MGDCPTCDGTGKVEAARPAYRPSLRAFEQRASACHQMPSLATYHALVEDLLAALRKALEGEDR